MNENATLPSGDDVPSEAEHEFSAKHAVFNTDIEPIRGKAETATTERGVNHLAIESGVASNIEGRLLGAAGEKRFPVHAFAGHVANRRVDANDLFCAEEVDGGHFRDLRGVIN